MGNEETKKPSFVRGILDELAASHPEYKNWFIGHFVEDKTFKNSDFEIKWSNPKKGFCEKKPRMVSSAQTLGILVKGKLTMTYPDIGVEETFDTTGDYWSYNGMETSHMTTVHEDTLLLTVRWPSKRK